MFEGISKDADSLEVISLAFLLLGTKNVMV